MLLSLVLFSTVCVATPSPTKRARMAAYNGVPLSRNNRVIETMPDDNFVERRDPILREALKNITISDEANDEYTPLLGANTTIEIIPTKRYIQLGELIVRSFRSATFRITNSSDIVITYEHDCYPGSIWSSPVHPLVFRKAYTEAAGHVAAAPKILFISPPAPLQKTHKTSFEMTRSEFAHCTMAGATVRYAIISLQVAQPWIHHHHLMASINRIENPRERFGQLFHIGARLLMMINNLHSRGILHGSITPETIISTREGISGKQYHFHLAGFSNAAWINPKAKSSDRNQAGRILARPGDVVWMSPWELKEGSAHMLSPRDEVFRIVEIIARSVSSTPDERTEMFTNKTLYQYKKNGGLFENGFLESVQDKISKSLISYNIDQVENLIRMDIRVPKYMDIAQHLFNVAKLLQGDSKWRFL